MGITCPFCDTRTKFDYYAITCCNFDGEVMGWVFQCPGCEALYVNLDNKDPLCYSAKDLDAWYRPQEHNPTPVFAQNLKDELSGVVSTLRSAAHLCFVAAYKKWRKSVGYPTDVRCEFCHAVMNRVEDTGDGNWAGGLYRCPGCGREIKRLMHFPGFVQRIETEAEEGIEELRGM